MKCLFYIVVILLFFKTSLSAQQNDFQVWPSVEVNMALMKDFRIHVEEEIRFHENSTQISRQINDIGASYRFNKYLKTGVFYRLEADWKNADDYEWRNGIYTDLSFRFPFKRLEAGYRMRIQSAKVEMNENESGYFSSIKHRHKLSITYNVKGLPLNIFTDYELFYTSNKEYSEMAGYRTWLGIDYTVNKTHTFSLKYGIDKEIHVADPVTAYIISAGYALDLKLYKSRD